MADYATHAEKARELLDAVHPKAINGKWVTNAPTIIAAAQVEALLALAAAVARQDPDRPSY